VPLQSRKTELFERYRTLDGVSRGYRESWSVPVVPPDDDAEDEAEEEGDGEGLEVVAD